MKPIALTPLASKPRYLQCARHNKSTMPVMAFNKKGSQPKNTTVSVSLYSTFIIE